MSPELELLQSPRSAIAQRRSLRQIAHRPWPIPSGRWLVGQSWHELLFAHWPVRWDDLRRAVPPALELDTFDGECWIGIVPFRMRTVRFAWCPPVAGTSSFAEVNLRTYVVSGDRPGVFFLPSTPAIRSPYRSGGGSTACPTCTRAWR